MTSHQSTVKRNKRSKNKSSLCEDDDDAVDSVTYEVVTRGGPVTKRIKVPMRPVPKEPSISTEVPQTPTSFIFEPRCEEPPEESFIPPKHNKRQRDYVVEFVDRIEDLLQAHLSREAWPIDQRKCSRCEMNNWAVWRCTDCTLARPVCRQCMRHSHQDSPLHRIERWTGTHFRRAALWEVGTYIMVHHHTGTGICDNLAFQRDYLETFQIQHDKVEQALGQMGSASASASAQDTAPSVAYSPDDIPMSDSNAEDSEMNIDHHDDSSDDTFLGYLESLKRREGGQPEVLDGIDDHEQMDSDDNEVGEDTDNDMAGLPDYLPTWSGPNAGADYPKDVPEADALNNTHVRIVHTNGIHYLAMVACHCQGQHFLPVDLIASRLVPASFIRIRTLFLAQVLDYFWLCNLELKASAYQFYQLIRRLTLPMAPSKVLNLYHEFRRMSRLWHWMKNLKWAGYGHNQQDPLNPPPGKTSNFCPACPQPGINLPSNWKDDVNWQRSFVADGNFKANHIWQTNPDGDVWLCDGSGMMLNRQEYFDFLKTAHEKLTKAPCKSTFRAITNALRGSKACDITGIVGIACARHGCYAPNALVDLFKGEQQKNVDFAFLQALKTTQVDLAQGVILMYDIACQYSVHLHKRIDHALPIGLRVDHAIGLFHVHCHKDESTLPHRAEMLDDHASYLNHKKALGMPDALIARYLQASAMISQTEKYYIELMATVPEQSVQVWEEAILAAEAMRQADIKVMDIYRARVPDQLLVETATASVWNTPTSADRVRHLSIDPTDGDRQLVEQEREKLGQLLIQLTQLQEAAGTSEHIVPMNPGEENEVEFDILIDEFQELSTSGAAATSAATVASASAFTVSNVDISPIPVERQILWLPSNGYREGQFNNVKLTLRKIQATTHLNRLWDLIAKKSFHFSHVIRPAPRKGVRTKARKVVQALDIKIALHCRIYKRFRSRLVALGCDSEQLQIFRILTKDDVQASTIILDPNIPGSMTLHLSWIWGSSHLLGNMTADAEESTDPGILLEFRRVHWLHARAQKQRWQEELIIVTYEMQWTVSYFLQHMQWDLASEKTNISGGARAYVARQHTIWHRLALVADAAFRQRNGRYISALL
ncbi:hypothetical protein BYT27DRAFT_7250341 [Phlegmacium glaucopus]|nr:hypothetical protein BYT27DRAFT_7250341 [Phlegmacium glaucopus]